METTNGDKQGNEEYSKNQSEIDSVEMSESSNNIVENNSTELATQKSEETTTTITITSNEEIEVNHNSKIVDIDSSKTVENSDVATVQETATNSISEIKINKASNEDTSTENLQPTENSAEENSNDESVKIIEDIKIVSPTKKLNEIEMGNENEIMECVESTENNNSESVPPEKITTATDSQNSFLPEATVANYLKNSGLGYLQSQYGTDDSDEETGSDEESVIEVSNQELNDKEYRDKITVHSSDSDDSDVEYLSTEHKQKIIDLDELIDDDDDEEQQNAKHKGPIRVKGEFLLDDLPPIEDLKITVPETECVELGKIHSIVDQLVLVDSIPGTVPLDLDTVLFMDKGKTVLGAVFDVLGQIKSPLYCVRFNSNKQIKEKEIEIGQTVFVAPRTEHTQFIILDNLMRIRGSDASWENDIEPTDKHRDFSDDEEEINYRKSLRNKDRSNDHSDLTKRSRTASTSSTMSGSCDLSEINQGNQHNNHNGNQRYSGTRRGGYQPRPKFQRGGGRGRQNHYQHPPRFNYDNSGGSWHANYNNYNTNNANDYYQHQHQNSYQQQSQAQAGYPLQPLPSQQQQQPLISAQSNIYPNPYAIRPPYIPPNVMQQPLFPPSAPTQIYSPQTGHQQARDYPPQ